MIDNKIDDELLAKFFENNKIGDIPDDGFSDRVMHTLPKHNEWLNTLWTAVCAIASSYVQSKVESDRDAVKTSQIPLASIQILHAGYLHMEVQRLLEGFGSEFQVGYT